MISVPVCCGAKLLSVLGEPDILQAQELHAFHIPARNLQVFARTTCKESCANSELYNGLIQVCHLPNFLVHKVALLSCIAVALLLHC
jgi:hypothetical protein